MSYKKPPNIHTSEGLKFCSWTSRTWLLIF